MKRASEGFNIFIREESAVRGTGLTLRKMSRQIQYWVASPDALRRRGLLLLCCFFFLCFGVFVLFLVFYFSCSRCLFFSLLSSLSNHLSPLLSSFYSSLISSHECVNNEKCNDSGLKAVAVLGIKFIFSPLLSLLPLLFLHSSLFSNLLTHLSSPPLFWLLFPLSFLFFHISLLSSHSYLPSILLPPHLPWKTKKRQIIPLWRQRRRSWRLVNVTAVDEFTCVMAWVERLK